MKIDVLDLMERAFVAGFLASAEGYNGEYPFNSNEWAVSRELADQRREAIEKILRSQE